VTYDGARPYTNGAMHDVTELAQFELFTPLHYDMLATEHWAALVGDDGVGIGLVEPDALHMVGVSGNGDCCPSAYLAGVRQEVLDANVVYDYTYTLVVGSLRQIRTYAYAHRPDPRPRYVFAHDRRHFFEENATDAGFPIAGALRVRLPQDDPQLVGPESEWPARSVPRLYIRGAWHTQQAVATLWWGRADVVSRSFSPDRVRPFHVIPDGQFRTYRLDLFRNPTYRGTIDGIRLDPVTLAEPGGWVDVTCISWKPCPIDRSAERRLATDHGLIPFLDRFDTLNTSFWSINGNSLGALTAVAGGSLTVDVAPDAQPLPGQDSIGAGVYSRCTLAGDFDAQVDYGLDAWPPDNGVNVNFGVGHRTLFRHNGPGGSDWLSSYFPPFASGFAPATATTGSLRLARTGDFVRGYYRNVNGDWLFLDGARITAAPLNVSLSIFTNRPLPGAKDVRVAFDDFRVTRGEIDCP
jgi:hypothetical protein